MNGLPAVSDVVPHAPPILALEELLHWEPGALRARLTVRESGPFVRDGRVDTVCTLEWMAQAVAACLGCEAHKVGEAVRIGMVIACREMTVVRPSLPVGTELLVAVRRIQGTDSVSHFETEVRDGAGAEVARAVMTLFHGTELPTWVKMGRGGRQRGLRRDASIR